MAKSPLVGPGNMPDNAPLGIARVGRIPLPDPAGGSFVAPTLMTPELAGMPQSHPWGPQVGPGSDVRAPILPGMPVNRVG